jgi:hypothetical protein
VHGPLGPQAPLSEGEAVLIGLAVAVAILLPGTWQLIRHLQVMAHEGTHGIVGSLSGRTVAGIVLQGNADGGTEVLPPTGCGYLIAGFVGYLGPSAFGLGAARLIQFRQSVVMLWVILGLLAILLLSLTHSFGFVTVPLAGAGIYLLLTHTPRTTQEAASYAIAWMLLLAGPRRVTQVGLSSGDGDLLAERTSIPQLVWWALWMAGTLAALVIGARWILHPVAAPR